MTSCKRSWRNINRVARPLAAGVVILCLCVGSLAAQESIEDRYQKAIQFFNEAKMEDACDLLTAINKEKPGYKETDTYLNPACKSASQSYALEEKLFNEGVSLVQGNHFEDARLKFTQASKLVLRHPKYRTQIDAYLKQIDQMEARSREEAQFQEAVELFNDGKDEEATRQFTKIEQAKGTKAEDARTYLQRIKDRKEDSNWARATDSFSKGDYAAAKPLFDGFVRSNGKHAAEAQKYLTQISAAELDQQAFEDAVKAFNAKRYPDAKTRFQTLVQKGGSHAADAQSYLQRIDAAMKEEASVRETAKKKVADGQNPQQVAKQLLTEANADMNGHQYSAAVEKLKMAEILDPANRDASSLLKTAQEQADEQPLRQGLETYFQGKYDDAEKQLSQYIDSHGSKAALAYFFRGAARASRYYLSGEKDMQQKELALDDFRSLKKNTQRFQPPKDCIPPKILALYAESIGAPGHASQAVGQPPAAKPQAQVLKPSPNSNDAARPASPQCEALKERLEMGETLTQEEHAFLKAHCP